MKPFILLLFYSITSLQKNVCSDTSNTWYIVENPLHLHADDRITACAAAGDCYESIPLVDLPRCLTARPSTKKEAQLMKHQVDLIKNRLISGMKLFDANVEDIAASLRANFSRTQEVTGPIGEHVWKLLGFPTQEAFLAASHEETCDRLIALECTDPYIKRQLEYQFADQYSLRLMQLYFQGPDALNEYASQVAIDLAANDFTRILERLLQLTEYEHALS